jgi:hypothetical protein
MSSGPVTSRRRRPSDDVPRSRPGPAAASVRTHPDRAQWISYASSDRHPPERHALNSSRNARLVEMPGGPNLGTHPGHGGPIVGAEPTEKAPVCGAFTMPPQGIEP